MVWWVFMLSTSRTTATTKCVTRIFTQKGEMIIFESLLTTFKAREISKIGSSLKPNSHNQVYMVQIHDTLCNNYKIGVLNKR